MYAFICLIFEQEYISHSLFRATTNRALQFSSVLSLSFYKPLTLSFSIFPNTEGGVPLVAFLCFLGQHPRLWHSLGSPRLAVLF